MDSDYGDSRTRAFTNTELAAIGYSDDEPDREPKDEPTNNSH